VSGARARRRLMAHERYRRRALDLGAGDLSGILGAHKRARDRVADRLDAAGRLGTPWGLLDPASAYMSYREEM
jgi:hypothetical protein